ncbi:histidine kinase dimerization/phosphoacceptor domain -containing protein [Nonlabens antarcticus]|uniref:histidine kinase dimerization/phosphoacceptor domain -containing protein n=1 Tax=Nonlabens antarcticus TaxID=392714 RepID=UPI001890E4F3|nr:histidine kinase dimerization/phosphoacceptor domain -containing protein [Nonlabens antarcticus]
MKHIFLFIVLYSTAVWSQEESSLLISSSTYTSSDGYLISSPYHAIYDNSGWLWILGENKLSNEYVFGEKEIIIQRFDGANFFSLKIPKTPGKKIKKGHFFKHKEKGIYLKLYYEVARAELSYINTESLEMIAVDAYNSLDKKYIIAEEYEVEDHTRLIITSKNKFYSAEIDQQNLKLIDSIPFDKPVNEPFLAFTRTAKDYSMVKLLFQKEAILLDSNGKITNKLSEANFIDNNGMHFFPNKIHNAFKVNDTCYYYFDDYQNLFAFDKKDNRFTELPNTGKCSELYKRLQFTEDHKHAFFKALFSDYSDYQLYNFKNFKTDKIATIRMKNLSETYFKEFGKDLVVTSGNQLTSYTFKESKIKTFLKDKSVRTIKRLGNSTYIVATDSEGFFIIDVKKNTERQIQFMDKTVELPINYSRDILIEDNNTIITADSNYLYTIDSNYNLVDQKKKKVLGEEIIKVKDTIFTANQNGNVSKQVVNDETFTVIKNTENIRIREFATDGTTLYATSSQGIFEYVNGTFQTYEFENEDTDNLLSIKYLPNYGVLVSTKFGEVYTFDTTTKKLKLLYEDELNASIVGMVADDNNNLWLNTYAGIVSFHPLTNKVVRYTLKDGLYELEGNRFSTYKDPDGNILMGSFKGLSFFNPNKIAQNNVSIKPQITSISFFNSKEGRWEINTAPGFLKNTKEIRLPSEYRRFSTTVSVFGEVSTRDVKYRYRLLNKDSNSDWFTSYPGKELLYANLAAGTYTLQIEALDSSKNKIGDTLKLRIIAQEVFYKTWWFIMLVMIVTVGILSILFSQYKSKQTLYAKNEIALNEANIKSDMMLEIHHRIKNNLQIVSALLGWQRANSDNMELKLKLEDSQNRIMSIAGIHDLLYNTDNQNTVEVKEYVKNIIGYYKKLYLIDVNYHLKIDSTVLNTDQATPFSLLLNELINNSNKHAFDVIDHPEITICFTQMGEYYKFEYFDNGNFKQEDDKKKAMGMRIVEMMNRQLKGSIEIKKTSNFHLTLLLPSHG